MARLPWRQAAKALGLSQNELYKGLVSGRYPGYRLGGEHGRWIVDTVMVEQRMKELMEENVRSAAAIPLVPTGIRRVE